MEVLRILYPWVAGTSENLVSDLRRENCSTIGHRSGQNALCKLVLLSNNTADRFGVARVVQAIHHDCADGQHAFGAGAVGLEIHGAHHAFFLTQLGHAEIEAHETATGQAQAGDGRSGKAKYGLN